MFKSRSKIIKFWFFFDEIIEYTHNSVQCVWSHVWLACRITWPPELVWTNPLGVRPIGKRFKIFSIKNEFVTTLIAFNLNLHEKTWFWWSRQVGDDPRMNILNLMCSNGPGWWVGAQGCLKHGLDASRSNLRSKTAQRSSYWESDLINTVEPQWSIDMTDIHETHQSPQKSVSLSRRSWFNKFRSHNHDSQIKTVSTWLQNCDKTVFWPQNEVSLDLSNTGVMFNVCGDCAWARLLLGASSVGFEQ